MSPLEPNHVVSDLFSVKGLNVVITGAGGRGLGAMMTRALAQNGANKIFIIGRRQAALEETVSTCPPGIVVPIQGDVTSKESLSSCAEQIASQVPYLDVVIANSGIIGPPSKVPGKSDPTLEEMRDHWWSHEVDEFNQTMNVNTTGVFFTVMAFLPLLQKANELRPTSSFAARPQIVCVTSIAAFMRTAPASFAYSASKAGAEHMVKNLATKLTRFKIRCNCIAPGPFMSEMTEGQFTGKLSETRGLQEGEWPIQEIPLERAGGEEDIGGAILYLCSRAGSFLSGNTIVLDGGRLSGLPSSY